MKLEHEIFQDQYNILIDSWINTIVLYCTIHEILTGSLSISKVPLIQNIAERALFNGEKQNSRRRELETAK